MELKKEGEDFTKVEEMIRSGPSKKKVDHKHLKDGGLCVWS